MSTAAQEVVETVAHPHSYSQHENAKPTHETIPVIASDPDSRPTTTGDDSTIVSLSSHNHDSKEVKEPHVTGDKKALEVHSIPKNNLPVVFSGLMLTVFLAALDQTIVAVALPTIVRELDGDTNLYSWVGSAYLLTSSAFIPLW